jgi:ABC-2 type transport system ATP-binding protein
MLQLSDLTLEDIFLKITMADEVVRTDDSSDEASKPRIDIKVSPNGKLRAVKEADSTEENAEKTEDTENNGGEE